MSDTNSLAAPADQVADALREFVLTCRHLSSADPESRALTETVATVDIRGTDGSVHTVELGPVTAQGLFAALFQAASTVNAAYDRARGAGGSGVSG